MRLNFTTIYVVITFVDEVKVSLFESPAPVSGAAHTPVLPWFGHSQFLPTPAPRKVKMPGRPKSLLGVKENEKALEWPGNRTNKKQWINH